ncbi:MAG TPA: glycine cleavage T C-terminal barrel domain-containing protein [Bryobacteraceae bacterium]|nr:glycine cleavage T C-terminal barrel domain-containing protein [Bryobacteraceae bacterium]
MDFAAMTGYDALRNHAAWLDLSARGKIKLTGEDRGRLLHAMTTNHIQQLTPGTGCYAFFLNDKGRILADANILCRPDHVLLDIEPEVREKLYRHLDHYIIADDVTLEDLTEALATIAVEGPESSRVLERAGAPLPVSDYGSVEWGDRLVARLSTTGSHGYFVFVPVEEKAALIAALEAAGAVPADSEAFRVVRIEHGKPRYGEDLSERFLAQEANQPHALHFSKGCYLGQEIVERVRSRGQIHRVLMPLLLETQTPPEVGTKLQIGEASAAEITSAAYSPALGKVAALGYVRTEHARPHTALTWGDIPAEVAARSGV